jgi:hypothetical protein
MRCESVDAGKDHNEIPFDISPLITFIIQRSPTPFASETIELKLRKVHECFSVVMNSIIQEEIKLFQERKFVHNHLKLDDLMPHLLDRLSQELIGILSNHCDHNSSLALDHTTTTSRDEHKYSNDDILHWIRSLICIAIVTTLLGFNIDDSYLACSFCSRRIDLNHFNNKQCFKTDQHNFVSLPSETKRLNLFEQHRNFCYWVHVHDVDATTVSPSLRDPNLNSVVGVERKPGFHIYEIELFGREFNEMKKRSIEVSVDG